MKKLFIVLLLFVFSCQSAVAKNIVPNESSIVGEDLNKKAMINLITNIMTCESLNDQTRVCFSPTKQVICAEFVSLNISSCFTKQEAIDLKLLDASMFELS